MLKKTITYKDFNGEEVTEDFYFNLTAAEAVEANTRDDLEKIGKSNDPNKIFDVYTKILKKAYGAKSLDGRRFIKDKDDIRALNGPMTFDEFMASEAYANLFFEFMQNDGAMAADFFKQMLPADLENLPAGATPQDHQKKADA